MAYVVTTVDLAKNATVSTIWLAPTDGGAPRQLTGGPKHDRHPRFSPDGKRILFESDRSGETQLWVIDLAGGEARQLTTIASEARGGIWSPDGKQIAFVSAVYPEFSDKPYAESNAANKKRKEEIEKNPVKARVFTRLFYRHWDSWVEDKRQHLFVMPRRRRRAARRDARRPRRLSDVDARSPSATISRSRPTARPLVYTAPPTHDEAWSTNYDLCRVPIAGGKPRESDRRQHGRRQLPAVQPRRQVAGLSRAKAAGLRGRPLGADGHAGRRRQRRAASPARSIARSMPSSGRPTARRSIARPSRTPAAPIFKLSVKDGKFSEFASGGMQRRASSISADGKRLACTARHDVAAGRSRC